MMIPPQIPQHPFTAAQAARNGIDRRELDRLLEYGRIVRVFRGVYRLADLPDTVENRARAAALVTGPFTVICDRTAAWFHGVGTFEYRELDIMPPLETFKLRGRGRVNRDGCLGGERDLLPHDVEEIEGVLVTTPVRTALDLGCRRGRRSALAALDAFMRDCGVTRKELYAELPRYFRRRGVVQLRLVLKYADPRSESAAESWTRMEMIDHGLPVPELQWWVHDENGRPVFRLDMAYPKARVAVEYDGREFHQSDEAREADRLRRNWLRERGWIVIVVTRDSFTPEAIGAWIREIREALRIAA